MTSFPCFHLQGKQCFTTKYYISCRVFIDAFYQGEELTLYSYFYCLKMLNLPNSFSEIDIIMGICFFILLIWWTSVYFWILKCVFIFIQFVYFFKFRDFFFLTHGMFRSVLFNFQEFGYFPVIFLLFIFTLNPLWLGNTVLCNFSSFKLNEVFYGPDMICLGICSWTLENNVYSALTR